MWHFDRCSEAAGPDRPTARTRDLPEHMDVVTGANKEKNMVRPTRLLWSLLFLLCLAGLPPSSATEQSPTGSGAGGVWGVGIQIGMVEMGTHEGVDANLLLRGLGFARDLAVASGCIPTDGIDRLIAAMRNTRDTRTLFPQVNQYRIELANIVATNCVCGATRASADPACDTYASTAVEQAEQARRAGCPGISGPRWDATYQDHYGWCLHASQSLRDSETQARAQTLNACGVR